MTLTPRVGVTRNSIGIVMVARDVTRHAEVEAERVKLLRNRLVQSATMAALGQFVAGIAHALNNPLKERVSDWRLPTGHSRAWRPDRGVEHPRGGAVFTLQLPVENS